MLILPTVLAASYHILGLMSPLAAQGFVLPAHVTADGKQQSAHAGLLEYSFMPSY
jgi:hypothetical protein